jgi:hypothetical protein
MLSYLYLKDLEMKKLILCCAAVTGIYLSAYFLVPQFVQSGGDDAKELAEIKKRFGAVLELADTPGEGEINAIANLLAGSGSMNRRSGMMAIDLRHASGEFCMLEPRTSRYMIHFSQKPDNTPEDIIYFLNPETFKKHGLRVKDLPAHPTELGKMKPFKWYYYDGMTYEPHHGRQIGTEFIVMAIDVK